jgi:amino acid adenylation domain-containing protein
MELHGCEAEQAWQMMADYEQDDLDVQAFYHVLQTAAKDRLLVDKTPFYSVDAAILRQAEEYFDNALYIHLLRHPLGMIRSFEKARMERILSGHPYSSALAELAESGSSVKLAEMLWLHCNHNILNFLQDIPAERQCRLKFEDLVSQPQPTLATLCDVLDLPLHQDMLKPYQDSRQRMTDGLHAEGKMLGDIKFHAHQKIDAQVAESWRTAYKEDFLSEAAWSLAEQLGYQRELKLLTIPRLPEEQPLRLSFAQQRLWFLAQLEGRTATYNIPVVLRLEGSLDQQALRSSFLALIERHESLRVCFPAINGAATVQRTAVYDPLTVVELPALAAAEQQCWLDAWLDEAVHRPFDLESGPLLRLHLLKIGPTEHLLLLNMHHIVSDGWSMGVLIREWSQLYSAAVQQQELRLPELSIQYSDYAAWQKNWLEQGVLTTQLAYWREKLAGMPELLELPIDFPRPAMLRHQGQRLKSKISAAVTKKIKQISQEQGATLFMTLLAAFNVLLHRYSRQSDLAVGSPVANRSHHQTEELIGFFVNTLVFRTKIDSSQSFLDLLGQVRQTALEAYGHQDIPFEYLVEQLNPARSMSHAPLFQVMFLLVQSVEEPQFSGLNMSLSEPDYKVAKFDLTLTAAEQNGELVCAWEYDTDLFRAETIAALAEHFAVLLEGICARPEQPVCRLPLLTAAEIQHFSAQERVEYPAEQTVIAQFEAQAAKTPVNIAAVFAGQQFTYKELNRQANQLAHHLMTLGIGPEQLCGICVERSLDMLVGLLGILKAGGAYLPLDPDYPQERLHFMLEDAAVPVLLTQSCLLERLPLTEGIRTVTFDRDCQAIAAHSAENPALQSGLDNLAYVIYTSGSTGKPKGCLVTHANISRLFSATEHWYHFNEQDVWTLFHSYAFDFSVWEIWGALLCGGKLVVVPYLTSRDPEAFYQLLIKEQVTVLNQTPSAFRQLISVDTRPDDLALRYVIFGGEALDCKMLERWFARHPLDQPQLVNMYGITETTVHVTYCPLTGCQQDGGGIGIPIPDLHVWILDPHQQPVPVGVPGEMHVSGGGVTRGYLNRPELTAARFIELELFGRQERLYKTGDLARMLPDGSLEYLGRIDQQVKLRGFRIELGEIEAVLHEHEAVREAVVLLDDKNGNACLLAYIVPTEEAPADLIEVLRSQLRSRLPDYMVPAGFLLLDTLPLTSNGKLDHRALADLSVEAAEQPSRVAPRTDEEQRMTEIWAEVLRRRPEQIGVHDNFFDLGGHSLLATQLVSRIRTAFAAELSLRQLFALPTVSELARLLAVAEESDAVAEMEEGEL